MSEESLEVYISILFPLPAKNCLIVMFVLKNGVPPGSRRDGSHNEERSNLNNPLFAFVAKLRSFCQDSSIFMRLSMLNRAGGGGGGEVKSDRIPPP